LVDWSEGWATPRGLASQMRPWSEQSEWSGSSDAPWKLCSVRKRSDSNKAPSRNGNQPHAMVMNLKVS